MEALEAKVVLVGQAVAAPGVLVGQAVAVMVVLVAAEALARQEGPAGDSRGLRSAAQVSSAVVLAKFLTLRNVHR